MNKSIDFVGQPIFSQLLSLIEEPIIQETIKEHKANRCYKKPFLWDHLVSMLYGVYTHCTSGRQRKDGKSKGGMKVHTLLNADTNMPSFIKYTASALHDQQFYKYIKELPDYFIIAFDKAYINYKQFNLINKVNI